MLLYLWEGKNGRFFATTTNRDQPCVCNHVDDDTEPFAIIRQWQGGEDCGMRHSVPRFFLFSKSQVFVKDLVPCLHTTCNYYSRPANKQEYGNQKIHINTPEEKRKKGPSSWKKRKNLRKNNFYKILLLYTSHNSSWEFWYEEEKKSFWDPHRSTGCYCCWRRVESVYFWWLLICDCPYSKLLLSIVVKEIKRKNRISKKKKSPVTLPHVRQAAIVYVCVQSQPKSDLEKNKKIK